MAVTSWYWSTGWLWTSHKNK